MAIGYNPTINTDSLLLTYDAGNTKSYSGSGATWYDMSGRNGNATWTGTYGYSSSQGGYFTSTNAVATANIGSASYTSLTFTGWFYFTVRGGYTGLVFNRGTGNATGMSFTSTGTNLGYHWNNDANTYNYNSGLTLNTGRWYFCGVSVSPTTAIFCANNDTVTRTYTHASTTIGASLSYFGDPPEFRYLTGNMATASIYSRAFSASELVQAYYALRGRFGV